MSNSKMQVRIVKASGDANAFFYDFCWATKNSPKRDGYGYEVRTLDGDYLGWSPTKESAERAAQKLGAEVVE